jgi:hypothetical protein
MPDMTQALAAIACATCAIRIWPSGHKGGYPCERRERYARIGY